MVGEMLKDFTNLINVDVDTASGHILLYSHQRSYLRSYNFLVVWQYYRRFTTCWAFQVWPRHGFVQSQVNKTIFTREDYLLQKT